MPLFVDYYTIHDMENNQIGFVPHTNSDKDKLWKGVIPSNQFKGTNYTPIEVEVVEEGPYVDPFEQALITATFISNIVTTITFLFLMGVLYFGLIPYLKENFFNSPNFFVYALGFVIAIVYFLGSAYFCYAYIRIVLINTLTIPELGPSPSSAPG